MTPDDPRHGTNAGYMAHMFAKNEPCRPCKDAHSAYQKQLRTRRYLNRVDRLTVPARGVHRRLQALARMGWTWGEINRRLGHAEGVNRVSRLLASDKVHVTTFRKVDALYRELHMKPGPSELSRQRAIAKGWAPPLAWDDIDADPAPLDVKRCKSGRHILDESKDARGMCRLCKNEYQRAHYAKRKAAA